MSPGLGNLKKRKKYTSHSTTRLKSQDLNSPYLPKSLGDGNVVDTVVSWLIGCGSNTSCRKIIFHNTYVVLKVHCPLTDGIKIAIELCCERKELGHRGVKVVANALH